MDAGWPRVNLERIRFEYGGVTYNYTSFRNINDFGSDTSITPTALEELEVLAITYPVNVGALPSLALAELVSDGTVTDRVRIYRFNDRPASEVIVVDECPADLQPDHFVFYQPR